MNSNVCDVLVQEQQEFKLLASLSQAMSKEYSTKIDIWEGSPFHWLKKLPSRRVGAIGERLVAGWLATHNFNINRCSDSEADRVVEGYRVEIKLSTLWESGVYKFQQLRDQNYNILLCLGLSPHSAHCWVFTKEEVLALWHDQHFFSGQHRGAAGHDTAWFSINPSKPVIGFEKFGGTLCSGVERMANLTGRPTENLFVLN